MSLVPVGLAVRLGRLAHLGRALSRLVLVAHARDDGAVDLVAELRPDGLAVARAVGIEADRLELVFALREESVEVVRVLLDDGLVRGLGVDRVECPVVGGLLVHRLDPAHSEAGELAGGQMVEGHELRVDLAVGGVVAELRAELLEAAAVLADVAEHLGQRQGELRREDAGLLLGGHHEGPWSGVLDLSVGQVRHADDLGGCRRVGTLHASLGDLDDRGDDGLESLGDDGDRRVIADPTGVPADHVEGLHGRIVVLLGLTAVARLLAAAPRLLVLVVPGVAAAGVPAAVRVAIHD